MAGSHWIRLFPALLLCGTLASAQSIADERRALDLAKAQGKVAEQRAATLERRAAAEQDRAAKALAQSAAVASRIQSAEADIAAAQARIALIERLRAQQRARLATRQEPAVRLLAALQMMARRPPALSLVQPGSTRDLVHTRALLASTIPAIQSRTAGLRSDVARGRQLRSEADRALVALKAGEVRLNQERNQLIRLAAERRMASQTLSAGAIVEQDRAIAMGEKARDISDLMVRLSADSALGDRLAALPGPLLRPAAPGAAVAMPVETAAPQRDRLPYRSPVAGRIVAGLGSVSASGVRARGITIATRPNAQIVAPAAGRVVFAGAYRRFGRIVIIEHGSDWTTLLTGLDALDVAVGDQLLQGSPIGRAPVSEPSITVELRRGNRPIDITRLVG